MSAKRGVGRPRKEERRRQRGIHGRGRKKLLVPEVKGYHLRFVNDVGTSLHDLTKLDDYDYVTREEIGDHVGENSSDGNSDLGSKVRVLVDKDEQGKPIYAYLLKKKQEYYDADQAEAEESRQGKEETLRRGNDGIDQMYGNIR